MTDELKLFIEKYIYMIEHEEYEELYNLAEKDLGLGGYFKGEFTSALWTCNIHPEHVMNSIPSAFAYGCKNVPEAHETRYSPNMHTINVSAFCRSNIKSIDLSETNCVTIDDRAFEICHELTKVVLPKTIKVIGEFAFSYCSHLSSIEYRGTKQQFKEIQRATTWRKYSSIKQINCSDGVLRFK